MNNPPKGICVTSQDIGRRVIYRAGPDWEPEEGIIMSIGRIHNVFVRYGKVTTSKSTDMSDLDWA